MSTHILMCFFLACFSLIMLPWFTMGRRDFPYSNLSSFEEGSPDSSTWCWGLCIFSLTDVSTLLFHLLSKCEPSRVEDFLFLTHLYLMSLFLLFVAWLESHICQLKFFHIDAYQNNSFPISQRALHWHKIIGWKIFFSDNSSSIDSQHISALSNRMPAYH